MVMWSSCLVEQLYGVPKIDIPASPFHEAVKISRGKTYALPGDLRGLGQSEEAPRLGFGYLSFVHVMGN